MTRVAAVVPDLMDRSRFRGFDVAFLRSLDDPLPDGCEVLVVDLDRAGVLDGRLPPGVRVLGFASHVHRDVIAAAERAGVTEAMARSEMFRKLPDLLGP